jgi:hypothetical protein
VIVVGDTLFARLTVVPGENGQFRLSLLKLLALALVANQNRAASASIE